MSLVKNRKGGRCCSKCDEVVGYNCYYESESGVCGNCLREDRRADDLCKERTAVAKCFGVVFLFVLIWALGGHG